MISLQAIFCDLSLQKEAGDAGGRCTDLSANKKEHNQNQLAITVHPRIYDALRAMSEADAGPVVS
jgi:hypothetical protein